MEDHGLLSTGSKLGFCGILPIYMRAVVLQQLAFPRSEIIHQIPTVIPVSYHCSPIPLLGITSFLTALK